MFYIKLSSTIFFINLTNLNIDIMVDHSRLRKKVVAVDCEFIAIRKGQKWIQHVVEIAIVDLDLNTLFHERCRPNSLPVTGDISKAEFKKNSLLMCSSDLHLKFYTKFKIF